MKLKSAVVATLLLLLCAMVWAGIARVPVDRVTVRNLPLQIETAETPDPLPCVSPRTVSGGSLDSVGTAYVAGTTYWDMQHYGSVGKMIGVDSLGFVHVVWRKSHDTLNLNRDVYYNCWDPATQMFLGGNQGIVVNSSPVAGFATLAVTPSGWAFPAFHERLNLENTFFVTGAMDYHRLLGAFITTQPNRMEEAGEPIQTISPKIAVSPTGTLHIAAMELPYSTDTGRWRRLYYARGRPVYTGELGLGVEWDYFAGGGGFLQIDTAMVIAQVVCASRISERVAIVWAHSRDNLLDSASRTQFNNDLYCRLSEDGGLNWGPNVNLTNFIAPIDPATVGGDTAVANRVYTDCDAIFDANDRLHIAFTTLNYYAWEGTVSRYNSDIWHWHEGPPYYAPFSHVAGMRFRQLTDSTVETCWPQDAEHDLGNWQRMTQRPSLACDAVTGMLYCAYQWYDPQQVTTEGHAMADILLSVSSDGGYSWTDSLNVTGTGMPVDSVCHPAPAGEALSERDMSLAEQVTYENGAGTLHMLYELDTGCGEDATRHTRNHILYRRIAVADIPARPIHDPDSRRLHVDALHAVDPPASAKLAEAFTLYPGYPNPFNPTTHIQFDLPRSTRVTLKVFNVLGREVATLYDGTLLPAGAQTVTFDASTLSSGVYLYRLEAGGSSQSRKLVLLK